MSIRRNALRRFVAVAFTVCLLGGFAVAKFQKPTERFDLQVRNDFFAGFAGDAESLTRGMKACEEKLKTEPDHAEALVWHGSGLMFASGQRFRENDFARGVELAKKGAAEMDRAVELRPHDVAVRVPRAACLLPYSRYVPNADQQRVMLEKVIADYEETLRLQKPRFEKLSSHSRGELVMGLAEAYLRVGGAENRAKAFELLKTVKASDANTPYAKEADGWLKAPTDAPAKTFAHNCFGCHVAK
jgi:hypothetical protein